jgi:hypothetical protein
METRKGDDDQLALDGGVAHVVQYNSTSQELVDVTHRPLECIEISPSDFAYAKRSLERGYIRTEQADHEFPRTR